MKSNFHSIQLVGFLLVVFCLFSTTTFAINSYSVKISTFAGGNGEFKDPQKLGRLSNGDIIVSDALGHSLKRINVTTGMVTTIAGNGTAGFSGDGGKAVDALVNQPFGIAVSSIDEIYFADSRNHRIRKIDTNGNIATVVGDGSAAFAGDGGLATACSLNTPMDVSLSQGGEWYIADMYNYRIRKVLNNGTIVTFAGSGQSGHIGDGGQATSAAMALAYGVKVFNNGEVYISDTFNYKIRKVDLNGIITTVAGSGVAPYNTDNVLATAANLNNPSDVILLDSGELIIADTDNYRIRVVMPNGTIITTAGNGTASYSDGEIAEESGLSTVTGLVMVANGLLVADAGNKRIRFLQTRIYSCYGKSTLDSNVCNGQGQCVGNNVCKCNDGFVGPTCLPSMYYVTTIAGGNGEFKDPQKISRLSNGDYIVADTGDHSIKKISYSTGVITRIAGTGVAGFSGDGGAANQAQLNKPYGIAVTVNNEIYIADSLNHRIRFIDVNGNISTVAGTSSGFSGDSGLATSAKLNTPMDVTVGTYGDFFIADMNNYRIRRVNSGVITTYAGNGQSGNSGDGGQATSAALSQAYGVRVINSELYISDSNNLKVRKVDGSGVITTIAGSGSPTFNGDGLLATSSNMNHPTDVVVLPTGELLIVDTDNYRIRMVLLNGTMVTIAGNGVYGSTGDFGPAKSASLNLAAGLLVTQDGIVFTDTTVGGLGGKIRLLSTTYVPPLCNGMAATDPYVCNGKGSCIGKDMCKCVDGWNGTFCSNPQCVKPSAYVTIPCSGNGNCSSSGVCTCASDYYGPYCSLSLVLSGRTYTHAIMGAYLAATVNSLTLDGISNVDYTWAQISGPTISNLATMTNLNTPTLIIPGKFNALSFDNGLVAGSTYGFSLTAKITTSAYTTTITSQTSFLVQQNPTLTFTLQDDNTNQTITSGAAGTTVFRLTITGNSNPYSDSSFKYGFGFADSNSITILTDMREGPATFKLPYISGQSTIDIYVGCEGTKSYSIQKLTTITLTNPVSNLTPTQAITAIQNLFTSNSSAGDLLGAASLLNTINTTDAAQITNKQNLRNSIITSLSNSIASGDLTPLIKALATVTSVPGEITQSSADNAFDTMIKGTNNPQFSRDSVQQLVSIASSISTVSSGKSTTLGTSIGSKLITQMQNGDVISNSASNFGLAVSRGVSSISLGSVKMGTSSSTRATAGIECYFTTKPDQFLEFYNCMANSNWVARPKGERKFAPGTEREIRAVTYTVGSLVYDMTPMFDNGTALSGNVTSANDIQITFPYTGSLTPVCGIVNSDTTYTINKQATLVKGSGYVTCKTKVLRGNVLLLGQTTASSSTATPKKSTVVGGAESVTKLSTFLMCIVLIISMLLV